MKFLTKILIFKQNCFLMIHEQVWLYFSLLLPLYFPQMKNNNTLNITIWIKNKVTSEIKFRDDVFAIHNIAIGEIYNRSDF